MISESVAVAVDRKTALALLAAALPVYVAAGLGETAITAAVAALERGEAVEVRPVYDAMLEVAHAAEREPDHARGKVLFRAADAAEAVYMTLSGEHTLDEVREAALSALDGSATV